MKIKPNCTKKKLNITRLSIGKSNKMNGLPLISPRIRYIGLYKIKFYAVKKITAYTVLCPEEYSEILSAFLWELSPAGIEEVESGLCMFFETEAAPSKDEVFEYLQNLENDSLIPGFELLSENYENKNWNEEWEKNITVIHVSDEIVIKPTFKEYTPQPGQVVLHIDPKMSFGTGEHETTRMMLRAIRKHCKPGDHVLDAGAGSAILAIAAVIFGAKSAIAFDNDDWCYDNGIENCALNGVGDKVEIRTCEMKDIQETSFNMILANIQKNILIPLAGDFFNKLTSRGILLLSGILESDVDELKEIYTGAGFTYLESASEKEWRMLAFTKQD